jgi:hypothetical protein
MQSETCAQRVYGASSAFCVSIRIFVLVKRPVIGRREREREREREGDLCTEERVGGPSRELLDIKLHSPELRLRQDGRIHASARMSAVSKACQQLVKHVSS